MSGLDWRVTIWQDDDDVAGGTYSVALEKRLTRGFEARWKVVSGRTVDSLETAWVWARDAWDEAAA